MGDLKLLNGLDRGDSTVLVCAGLCEIEHLLSTFGEHETEVPW